jgi:hypothetical protein
MRSRKWAAVPRLLLAALGVVLILIGLAEMLFAHVMWLYVVHAVSGLVALAATPWRRLVKPTVLVIGALYLFLYLVESVSPGATGDQQNPSSNPSLIMTGFVLVVVMVALMYPWARPGRQRRGQHAERSDR